MKFIVSSGHLLRSLQAVSGVINSNNTLPILDNFLLELSPAALKITASDLETTISTSVRVDGDGQGMAAVPARILVDTLKSFPEQPLTFTFDLSTHSVELSSDFGKYSLAFVEGEEFPQLPDLEDASHAEIPAHVLTTAIQKTLFAAGNDELRPVMSGVFFQFASDSLTFVATDAHKLVRYRRTDFGTDHTAEFILPKKPLTLLRTTLGTGVNAVKIAYTTANARFEYDDTVLTCRLIDGKYPNYEAVIPRENPNRLTLDRGALLSSTKRVSLFANKTTHQIRMKVAGNELHISAEDVDFANKAHERLTCNYEGNDIEIGFNSRFISEMLSNLESEDVRIELSAPNRAGLIVPVDGIESGEDVLMLVMPVMLNS